MHLKTAEKIQIKSKCLDLNITEMRWNLDMSIMAETPLMWLELQRSE